MSLRRQRVMEDLDALLADLQATGLMSNHMDNQHGVPSSARQTGSTNIFKSCATPTYDLVRDSEGQPLYEPQQVVRPPYSSGAPSGRPLPDPASAQSSLQRQPLTSSTTRSPSGANKRVSTLSSNLSELDNLLAELSSAQFTIEVDRRTGGAVAANMVSPPGSSLFTANKERSVDSLLSDLDNTLPLANRNKAAVGTSTATQDLDELMASLSGMTMTPGGKAAPYAVPEKPRMQVQSVDVTGGARFTPVSNQNNVPPCDVTDNDTKSVSLQEMMEKLDNDMTRQGVMTVPKGHCAACAKPIVGQVITALARLWHPEHFMCVHCKEPIGTRNFFERDNQPYCERDYHLLFSPTCASCNLPIIDKCLTALDRTWHPEHFVCSHCGHQLSDAEGFHEREGLVYCRHDYYELFAPRCGSCQNPILENFISALNKQWHPDCFVCRECRVPFGAGNFFDHEGFPYCETHYHAARGSLCASCRKPITGRCITAMYKKFHPEHFVCTFCQRQLNKGTFKEENEKPYCHPCFVRLFS